ncbi:MAG: type VI secretion system baseplate subunit TssE [Phycisphaerales bacterium]|nr:type VI secretion system baseplate subunit TssE [Phycisphaerales bacterium]
MADLTPRERRQPCLLDRLTDDERQSAVESREKRVISGSQFRRAVLRDLGWLLNSNTRLEADEAAEFPLVATSVLNFGVPDLCGLTSSSIDPTRVQRTVQKAVEAFEPRVLRRSLKVRVAADPQNMGPNAVGFEINGELWAQPMPERLYVKTDVDLETGEFRLEDRPNG